MIASRKHPFTSTASLLSGFFMILLLSATGGCSGGGEGEAGNAREDSGTRVTLLEDGAYPEPFSYLSGVREMPDGTLLAADPLGQVLLRLDLDAGTADTLGRVGEGPEEYRQPDRVFPLPGDSTLLVDLGNGRLTTVDPEGNFVDGMPIARQTEGGGGGRVSMTVLLPTFVDARGNLYYAGTRGPDAEPPDSSAVVRFNRGTEVLDTVATFWLPELRVERSGNNVRVANLQLEGRDDWAVGADGRVAVVHADGYSVEWFFPDGSVVRGPPTSFEAASPTDADKEAIVEERAATGMAMMMTAGREGATSMMMRRGGLGGMQMGGGMPEQEWAEAFPPFRDGRTVVSPAGEAWVERWGHQEDLRTFDIFDDEGIRIATVELPRGSRLIGFGTNRGGQDVAYVGRMDEVGLWWLERYRIQR